MPCSPALCDSMRSYPKKGRGLGAYHSEFCFYWCIATLQRCCHHLGVRFSYPSSKSFFYNPPCCTSWFLQQPRMYTPQDVGSSFGSTAPPNPSQWTFMKRRWVSNLFKAIYCFVLEKVKANVIQIPTILLLFPLKGCSLANQ